MADLYLIAHKVRGLRAFDIAEQMEMSDGTIWWIIPTSGHRAYPATFMHLDCVTPAHVEMMKKSSIDSLRDHYEITASSPRPDYPNRATSTTAVPRLEDI